MTEFYCTANSDSDVGSGLEVFSVKSETSTGRTAAAEYP